MTKSWDRLSFAGKLAVFLFFIMWAGFTVGLLVSFPTSWATIAAFAAICLVNAAVIAALIYVVNYYHHK
jgi:hypothetical protein